MAETTTTEKTAAAPAVRMLGKAKGRNNNRRRNCRFCIDSIETVDYKNPQLLKNFVTERGKLIPRRISGNCAKHQRKLTMAVRRARLLALMPFTVTGK